MKNQLIKFTALCAFVCGSFVAANAQTPVPATPASPTGAQAAKMTPEQRVEMRLNRMKTSLNLSDDQTAKVKTLLTDEMTAMKTGDPQARKANKEKMDAEMTKILTPEQLTKYKDMMGGKRPGMQMGK